MNNVWECLSTSQLISYIGEERIRSAKNLIPHLVNESERNSYRSITEKKSKLAELFQASAMSSLINKKDFRRELINQLEPEFFERLFSAFPKYKDSDKLIEYICSKPWKNNDTNIAFCEALGIPLEILPEEKEDVPDIRTLKIPMQVDSPFKQLKDYQFRTILKIYKELEIARQKMIVQMPTGSGKTRVAMELVCQTFLSIKKERDDKINIIWLVNREELLDQAYKCFLDVWSHLGNQDIDLIRFINKSKNKFDQVDKSSFALCGIDKLYSEFTKNPNALGTYKDNIRLIIYDEAHGTQAKTYNSVVRNLANKNFNLVGLTATPGRENKNEQEEFTTIFNDKLISLDCDGENPISYLKKRKVLSKTKLELIEIDTNIKITPKDEKYISKNLELPRSILDKLSKDDIRNLEILKKIQKECQDKKKIMVFGIDLNHSRMINSILCFLGIKSVHIDGTTKNRKYILEEFKNDKIQVICNGDLLATGFDAPKVDVVVITRPVGSKGLKLQMIGRGLRGPLMGGTEYCKIIDVKDKLSGSIDCETLYDEFTDYFETRDS